LLHERADERREQPGVGAGLHLEMDVGDLGGLGAPRIDHDQAAARVFRDLPQGHSGARDAVREPGILAEEERHLAVLEVGARVAAHHPARDPELTRLLLGERAGAMDRAKNGARAPAVRAREVVPLPAATIVEDRLPAMGVADGGEARRDLTDCGLPVDLLEGAVVAPAQRLRQAVGTVLVEVEPQGLLAGVSLRRGMRIVASHADEPPPAGTAQLDLDAAVALAQDTGGRLPLGLAGGGLLGHVLVHIGRRYPIWLLDATISSGYSRTMGRKRFAEMNCGIGQALE